MDLIKAFDYLLSSDSYGKVKTFKSSSQKNNFMNFANI